MTPGAAIKAAAENVEKFNLLVSFFFQLFDLSFHSFHSLTLTSLNNNTGRSDESGCGQDHSEGGEGKQTKPIEHLRLSKVSKHTNINERQNKY